MSHSPFRLIIPLVLLLAVGTGCVSFAENPSFSITTSHARAELKAMEAKPIALERPIVIVGGFLDLGIGPRQLASNLKHATGAKDDQVLLVSLFWCGNFDECRQKIVDAIEATWPSDDPSCTREVDVIGLSMGGVAARYAALPPGAFSCPAAGEPVIASTTTRAAQPNPDAQAAAAAAIRPAGRRLSIHRLFTLASPHQGAVLASFPGFSRLHLDMRRGSDFLTRLNGLHSTESFPIIPYTRVPDNHVGSAYTAPPGQCPIWIPNGFFEEPHLGIFADPRVAADVARRLRGEKPYATEPAAPLP